MSGQDPSSCADTAGLYSLARTSCVPGIGFDLAEQPEQRLCLVRADSLKKQCIDPLMEIFQMLQAPSVRRKIHPDHALVIAGGFARDKPAFY
ncbi:hypothetical protein [Hoeflea sp.]|uniref:hypothetical protein n=1 Tax=Hoeflea sp. TaxID=1940281 RepID=UPI001992DB58|nr:hypothetical protein [Hoeflea sp.]MBC7279868.1 hypothetical protein [Hoeflea sp.]